MLLLKQSVFRSNTMGVTKNTLNRACDLICGAGHAYGTGKGTTILAMHLFDRALSLTAVRKNEAVLLAATCLLTAAKLEEINVRILSFIIIIIIIIINIIIIIIIIIISGSTVIYI